MIMVPRSTCCEGVALVVAGGRVGHERVRTLGVVGDVGAVGLQMLAMGGVISAGTPGHEAAAGRLDGGNSLGRVERVGIVALLHEREHVRAERQ